MTEGVIVSWLMKVGDQVKVGDILAEVETDKATMELENFVKGTVLHLEAKEGEAIPVDSIIAVVGNPGDDYKSLLAGVNTHPSATETIELVEEKEDLPIEILTVESKDQTRLIASPLAKKIAQEKGIDIRSIQGSGDGGRIVKRDIDAGNSAIATSGIATSYTAFNGSEGYDEQPVSQMRKTIAKRLSESKFTVPHFYLTMEILMDKAVEARTAINEYTDMKVSVNDLIVKAAATALRKHPKVNSSWLGDKIRFNHHIHIGVAMALEEGLLVPVVRFADQKSLSQISSEVKTFSARAKEKKLQSEDWTGNTFTISNLGMFGIEAFTAIINTPDTCIMAVGAVRESVIVENGQMRAGHTMKVTLSCDHRVVDGVVGSRFLVTFKELLEQPVKLLV